MILLTSLGLASMGAVAVFTWATYHGGADSRAAVVEAWVNIVIGFAVNFCANFLIFPLVGTQVTAAQNFWMGWIFTAVSVARQYAVRRYFQQRTKALAQWLAGVSK